MSDPVSSAPLQRSPLHNVHLELGGRMVPFAGWEMPVQFSSIVDEHKAVRESVGVFDISHMGQILVSGTAAESFLNQALTNDCSVLEPGQGQYSLLLNDEGGVIDDLIVYRTTPREFFLVVNASRIAEDWAQLEKLAHGNEDVELANASAATAGVAVQGPRSAAVCRHLFGVAAPFPPRNTIFVAAGPSGFMWLCGTGYTGEEGFEFFMPATEAEDWFRKILAAVKAEGGLPCGLGARDTLRLEMGYPLNGNDLSPGRTPLQAGLGFFVKLDKPEFVGRQALLTQKAAGLPDKLTALRMTTASPPPRPHYPVFAGGENVGEVCSGTQSPSLGCGIAMAYLPPHLCAPGTALEIEVRGRRFPAEVVKKPFYSKKNG